MPTPAPSPGHGLELGLAGLASRQPHPASHVDRGLFGTRHAYSEQGQAQGRVWQPPQATARRTASPLTGMCVQLGILNNLSEHTVKNGTNDEFTISAAMVTF